MNQSHLLDVAPVDASEYAAIEDLCREVIATDQTTLVLQGEAIVFLEAAARGLGRPGGRALNLVSGPYGRIFGEWLSEAGSEVENLVVPFDRAVRPEEVEKALERSGPVDVVSLVHAEAATGVVNDVAAIAELARSRGALVVVALLFFGFLYRDERALNSFEDRMQDTVSALPAGQRVISAIDDPGLRVNALTHMIDRVCIGHCYSYANYEPTTAQFRIRAEAPNPYVAYTYEDSWLMQVGAYVVQERDVPLYQVDLDSGGRMIVKSLRAGVRCERTTWNVLGDLL